MIELTEQQRSELAGPQPVQVVDPVTKEIFVLLRSDEYARIMKTEKIEPDIDRQFQVPDGIRISQETFLRDLPDLMANPKICDHWVLYHRTDRVGVAANPEKLRREIRRRGIPQGEYFMGVICHHEPDPEEIEPIHPHHFEPA